MVSGGGLARSTSVANVLAPKDAQYKATPLQGRTLRRDWLIVFTESQVSDTRPGGAATSTPSRERSAPPNAARRLRILESSSERFQCNVIE